MHIAMLRRTVLSREISSGKNPEIRENRTNSTLVRPPILFGLISIMMLILVSSTGHGGDVELKDSVKAMHTCSWSTGATDSVNEGTTAVETLSATSDSSGTCSYSIVGGVDSGDFSISGAALSFSSAPDYENPNDANSDNIYSVQIRATDSADSATTDLTLSVTVNDLTLAITGSQSFSVLETASVGTEIGTVTLSSDTADAWAILSGNTGSAFSLDSSNGVLTTAAGLDYETLSSYTLQVLAANGDESDIEAVTISVTNEGITVTDTSGNVQETASNGDSVVDVDATGDDDIALSWSITSGNTGTAFAIDNNGLITVNDASALNFESLTSYTLTVQATDSGSQTDTEDITISVLDVAPTVTDTSANLAETAAVSAAVVTVSTTGDTTSLTWSIASGNDDGVFAIGASTGAITVADTTNLDREATASYDLVVRATDGTTPDTETITITITDVAPTVTDTAANLAETAAVSAAVVTVSTTGDTTGLTWSIASGNDDGVFAIGASTGAITVADTTNLDKEATASYDLVVQATDGTTPDTETITITITDVAPTVTDTAANLAETASASDAVVTVSTTGDTTGLTWSIASGNDDGVFAIGASTGAITVADTTNLDREATASYDLVVRATDGTTPDTETITITITDVAPTVTDTAANLAETASASDAVATVSTTGDTTGLTWSIASGNDDGVFAIGASTGAITVADTTNLDRETTASYDLVVRATDGTTPDTETITITITDVAPTVTDTAANLAETASASDAVVTVSTTGDTTSLTWSIASGNDDGVFAIGASTGAITVADTTNLDREATASYDLVVRATDGTTPDTETITITITDVAPTVTDTAANLAETASASDAVVTVSTTGDTTGLTWSIASGNDDGVFAIGASTGAITVADTTNLDKEATASYDLVVRATDGTTPDTETITITITDVAPTVTDTAANLAETASASDAVVTVSTTGDTTGLTWSIASGNDDGVFAIGASTGAITVADTTNLDREATASYDLVVQATDGTTPDTETITITITDVAPTVTDTAANLAETASASDAVVTVSTTGDTTGLTWSIASGNDDGLFAIGASTGAITVADTTNLDRETTASYDLVVRATDGTTPDTETITITITDVAPTVTDTAANLAETASASDAVVTVSTTGDTTSLTWSIASGNDDGVFAIGASTGAITVADTTNLDREATASYDLVVQATDGTTPDTETITITITDVAPTVTDTAANLAEDASASDAVVTVSTTGDTTGLTWSIASGNDDGVFAIGASTGAITVADTTNLDYETAPSYDLVVQATDGTTPDTETITITITDVALTVTDTSANLAETAAVSAAVVDVDNTGDDDISPLAWSITSGNDDGVFAIGATTGAITVADTTNLDFETTASYDLVVQVSDGAGQTDTETITITITNSAPTVTDTAANLAETASASDAVVTVSTTGDDDSLTWSIASGNDDGVFAIGASTGAITVADTTNLDRETTASYDLVVRATDGTTPDTETITITITDVAPTVTDTAANLAETASASDAVVTVSTTGDTTSLTWSIASGNDDGVFAIGASTGAITVADTTNLDRETTASYDLVVQATDGTTPDTETITITITDVAPTVTDTSANLAETASASDAVVTVSTTGDTTSLTWSIASGNDDGVFAIGASTGAITVADTTNLDREATASYDLVVQATDGTTPDTETITITITDVAPTVTDTAANLAETAAVSAAVVTVSTTGDTTGLTWSIASGNDDGVFAIGASTGAITVADTTNLDREATASYDLVVRATDGTTPDTETITITITDVAPTVTDTAANLAETASASDAVVTVSTTGDTTSLTWSIASGNDDGVFAIGASTGAITVADTTNLDKEATASYDLVVRATDGTTPDTETITITITDVAPTVTDTAANLAETASASAAVVTVSTTGDTTSLTWSIASGNDDGVFAIGASTGAITVADTTNLDREATASYDLVVQATDGTTPDTETITITITDVAPTVTDTAANLAETASASDAVVTVSTTGDTTSLTWSIASGNDDGVFAIGASTGAITVADTTNLDRETTASYDLVVRATDGTTPDTETITITITDVAPTVTDTAANLAETASASDAVVTVTTTGDTTGLTWSIASGNDDGVFAIGASTGAITVADTTNLDREATASYDLVVRATDGTTPDTETITITITDVAPTVTDTAANLAETASASDAVVTVSTTGDTTSLTWSIASGNDDGVFAIGASTGAITVADTTNLDKEATASYDLVVRATDGTTPDTETITITITDVAPTVTDTAANLAESASTNAAVVTVSTTGDTTSLTWSIASGNDDGVFAIGASTGAITVADTTNLDKETTASYDLVVQATDGTTPDTETITITITDVAPTVTDTAANLAETASASDAVVTVSTTGDTTSLTWSIASGNDDGVFAIGASTGAITVADTTNLDMEATASYDLVVRATDGTTPDTETITITITDVAPTVTDTAANLAETAAVSAAVVTVSTTGDTTSLTWSIVSGNDDGVFAIDASTGAITVADTTNLDREATASYDLVVQATDGTTPDTETITITITDVAPTVADTAANLAEDASASDAVVTVSTTGDTTSLTWSIASGNDDGVFAIGASTGAITVADTTNLDREATASYDLVVQATDGTTPDTETITITITDVAPTVTDTAANLAETASASDAVVTVSTTGDTTGLTWSIASGNDDGVFAIGASTGAITVADTTNLDREATASYDLVVQATDGTTPDTETITITITDVAPTVADTAANLAETASASDAVVTVSTTGDTTSLTWSIASGNDDGVFAIGASTGAITVADTTNLDKETTASYDLVVQATDGTTPDTETITITITDVAPTVTDTAANLAETASASDAVVTVSTTGDTTSLTWSIASGNDDGVFAIGASTGAITVADTTNLDREATASYDLVVQATDGTTPDTETITITITDVAPTVTDTAANLAETAAVSAAVVTVSTTGDTTGLTWSIASGNDDGVFAIGASTGAITVADTTNLDREATASYDLVVRATDGTTPDTETITITITDVAPTVTDTAANLAEDASVNDAVVTVSTTGDTTGLTWSIASGNDDGVFAIGASTGAITVADTTNLDYETTTSYDLVVQATDGTTPDTETITITITNTVLTITNSQSGSVAENSAQTTAVMTVSTSGDDAAAFQILLGNSDSDGDGNAPFAISSAGAITVNDQGDLNYESKSSYSLLIVAYTAADASGDSDSSFVTINVNDVDEFDVTAPSDTDATSNTVQENSASGTTVGVTASSSDADGTTNTVTYTITAQSCAGIFAVGSSTGIVTVDNSPDRESTGASCTVTVRATSADLSTEDSTFTVTIADVAPTVTDTAANLAETASASDAVVTVSATGDTTGLTWSIASGNDDGVFAIGASTGAITVADTTNLDRETTASYDLVVQATDGTTPDTETITITITDVAPTVTDTSANLAETAAVSAAVVTVSTTGDTTGLTWSIASGNDDGVFAIGASTGAITVADTTNLDKEATASYDLVVRATDGTTPDTETITITITDVAPTVTDTAANLAETASASDAVVTVSTTGDTTGLTWSIASGNDDGVFAIGASTGAITVADTTNLDRETTASYDLVVRATDGTTPDTETITITITDVAPTVTDTAANLVETASASDAVVTVSTTGDTTSLTWSIASGNDDGVFAIGASTGAITVADTTNLDREATASYDLVVRATDGTTPDTETITITIIDVAPTVTDTAANLAETASASDAVVTVSTTGDTTGLTWSIASGNDDGVFAIGASTGAITVADTTNLDKEATASYDLVVQATDGTTPDTETITITITDVAPTVTDTAANLAETASASDAVVTVSTTGDTTGLTWSIASGNDDGVFAIGASTGAITVADTTNLDREATASYDLVVQATDGTTPDTETITITITDVAPTVTDTAANLAETASASDAVVTVSTTGDTTGLTWSIASGNDDGVFAIGASTGAITVADTTNLDREATASYDLVVQATDGTTPDTETITITITDVAPTVTDTAANLAEDASASDAVVTVSTTGDTTSLTWSIASGNDDGVFAIGASTGAITVADTTNLDYETTASYDLVVQATDGTTPDTETITITITDVALTVTDTSANLAETAAVSAAVVDVDNTGDDDISPLAWSIASGNDDGVFAIGASTGAITVADTTNLDREATASYDLVVQVSDGAGQTDTETITITITDSAPTVTDTAANLAETASASDAVVTVSTTGDTTSLTWSIASGNDDGVFAIGASTGAITVADTTNLDRETTASYDLVVQATDGTTPDTETITITITDVAPTVTDTSANLAETASASDAVVTVSTTGDTTSLTWSIASGNDDGVFAIGASTGAITVADTTNLDREATASYDLVVQATDGTTPDTETITITITDVAPTVTDTSANLVETAAVSAAVVTVSTTGDTTGLTWSIASGNDDGVFAIGASTGAITVADTTNLDRETTASYDLVVQATDGTTPDTETITITITDVAPTVTDTSANLAETASASDAVVTVSTTGDTTSLTWSIASGNDDGVFAIGASTGAITVADTTNLDREATASYDLVVRATDGTTPDTETITITITDVAPTVTDTAANLAETASASDAVVTVTTTGDTTGLTWSIASGNDDGVFAIGASTGAITVADTTNLDREATASYDLVVQATDGTTPDTETITITITDVAPTVTDTAANLAEDASASDAVVTVSTTGDTTGLTWSIASGNDDGVFAIGASTGAITVADTTNLDRETTASYDLVVQATDGTTPDTETITITITDVAPTVTDTAANLAETASASDAVVTVSTTGDTTSLTWSIASGNDDGVFAIGASTGAITVADTTNLDRETTASYDLVVRATDGTTPDTETITITITDVAPTVTDTAANLAETASASDAVVTVSTTGDTTGLTWSIASGNDDGVFAIGASTGAITVADTTNLDREATASYDLVVRATDGTTPDTETITITITDVAPTVTDTAANLAETASASDAVVTVSTTGDTTGLTWSIASGNDDGVFAIGASTGAITVADTTNLDKEATASYDLVVRATDGTTPDTETITITITDVAPTVADTAANLAEDASASDAVVTVTTTGDTTSLTWSIASGNDDGVFAIGASTGAITVADTTNLDYETTASYDLVVRATDGTTPDTETITITITDVALTVTDTSANLAETAAVSAAVVDVDNTGDDDISPLAWSIASGNDDGVFAIGATTGAITVADTTNLDRETTASYDLVVQVSDGAGQTDTETITITITDVAPTVTDTAANLAESASTNAAVVTVSTTGDTTSLTWSIASGNDDGVFAIGASTGAITVADTTNLDKEATASYDLVVQATDGTTPDTETITITITDVAPTVTDTAANLAETASASAPWSPSRRPATRRASPGPSPPATTTACSPSAPQPAPSPWPTRPTSTRRRRRATTSSCGPRTARPPTPRRSPSRSPTSPRP